METLAWSRGGEIPLEVVESVTNTQEEAEATEYQINMPRLVHRLARGFR